MSVVFETVKDMSETGAVVGRDETKSPSTTISTIAVQSGSTRIILALLQSKENIQLKIQEMYPAMTEVGISVEEAVHLLEQHKEALRKLQTKQSPVEELLNQVDELIAHQRPRAEVYEAMAENLGVAWKDLNSQLEFRTRILEQAVIFHRKSREFSEKMDIAEKEIYEIDFPLNEELCKTLLSVHNESKKGILECSMQVMNEGQLLLEMLRQIGNSNLGDSRPYHMDPSVNVACCHIEHCIEALQDRRRHLELLWKQRKLLLEQHIEMCLISMELDAVQMWIVTTGAEYKNKIDLGESVVQVDILKNEHQIMEMNTKEKQDHTIHLLHRAEQLFNSGYPSGEGVKTKAYSVLSESSDLLAGMDSRHQLLEVARKFFTLAEKALYQVAETEVSLNSGHPQLGEVTHMEKQIDNVITSALEEGYAILSKVQKSDPGVKGVVKKIEELEASMQKITDLCAHILKKNAAHTILTEKYTALHAWVLSILENFLKDHREMGGNLAGIEDFLGLHIKFQSDVKAKYPEVDSFVQSVIAQMKKSTEFEMIEVQQKADNLLHQWKYLESLIERRISLSRNYASVHKLTIQYTHFLDSVEQIITDNNKSMDAKKQYFDSKRVLVEQQMDELKTVGKRFIEETYKVDDPYLNTRSASICIEKVIEQLFERKNNLITNWQTMVKIYTDKKAQWEILANDIHKSIQVITSLDDELFPIIPKDLILPDSISLNLKRRMESMIPLIKRVELEMQSYARAAEVKCFPGNMESDKNELSDKLNKSYQDFDRKIAGYENLVKEMIQFFEELQKLENLFREEETSSSTFDIFTEDYIQVNDLLKKYEINSSAILSSLKFCSESAEHLINKINDVEPYSAAVKDRDKIMSLINGYRSRKNNLDEYKKKLTEHQQHASIAKELKEMNQHIEDLSKQLFSIKDNCTKSLTGANASSSTLLEFKSTVKIVEETLEHFLNKVDKILLTQSGGTSHLFLQVQNLKKKWSSLTVEADKVCHLIEVSLEYFHIMNEAEEWIKEGNKLLVATTRKSITCRTEDDVDSLLEVIENFLKSGKMRQDDRLKQLSSLAMQLYGGFTPTSMKQILERNKELLDGLANITRELSSMMQRIREEEGMKEKGKLESSLQTVHEEMKSSVENLSNYTQSTLTSAHLVSSFVKQMKMTTTTTTMSSDGDSPVNSDSHIYLTSTESHYKKPHFVKPLVGCEVPEGAKCTFYCQVDGYPQPYVEWFKDKILIQNNPDYCIRHNNGICTLTIEETLPDDSAWFTCKATNAAGTAESRAQLLVKEGHSQERYRSPYFVKLMESGVAKEGEPFQFQCQVAGVPLPLVSWLKDGICIDTSPDYTSTYNNGLCKLQIEHSRPSYEGLYCCRAVNPGGKAECTAVLKVQRSLVPTKPPNFTVPLSNVMARAGQKLRLECHVSGHPQPQLTWLHDNKHIKENRDLKLHYDGNEATLVVSEAFPKHAGSYTVIAKNSFGEAITTCTVFVKGRLPLETSDSELPSDLEPVKPHVIEHLKNQTVDEGSKVRMDCVIVGQPEPEVIWYHNKNPVKESNDIHLLFEGDRCSLVIKEAYPEDSGWYRCVAINSAGEASSQCHLDVESHVEIHNDKSYFSSTLFADKTLSPPTFISHLVDTTVEEGSYVQLQCKVTGYPLTVVTWYRDGQKIEDSKEYQINYDRSGCATLSILEVSSSHKGLYQVKASNSSGHVQSYCRLSVTPKKVFPRLGESPPHFESFLENIHVTSGKEAKFQCIITGNPTPEVKWFFKGFPITQDEDHRIRKFGKEHTLVLPHVKSYHKGRYTITAENNSGKATSSALLTLEESFNDVAVINGSESKRMHSLEMKKQTASLESHTTKTTEIRMQNHSIEQDIQYHPSKMEFHEMSNGVSRVHTMLSRGEPLSIEPSFTTSLRSPGIAPSFLTPLSCIIVQDGEDINLDAYIEGDPEPQVKWLKDGAELYPSYGTKISFLRGKASLKISKAKESDTGIYTCSVVNSGGSATCSADVVVRAMRNPPQLLKPLEAKYVRPGDRVNFEIEVSGDPTPTVSWLHNDIPLEHNPQYQIISLGAVHCLLIPKASKEHNGKVTVKVINAGGEVWSTADLIVSDDTPSSMYRTTAFKEMTINRFEQKKEISSPFTRHTDMQ